MDIGLTIEDTELLVQDLKDSEEYETLQTSVNKLEKAVQYAYGQSKAAISAANKVRTLDNYVELNKKGDIKDFEEYWLRK